MDLIIQGLIALGGIAVSILIATAKAKTIARVTAQETAEAELNKVKEQKWWDKKVKLYEEYIVGARKLLTLNLSLEMPTKEYLKNLNPQELTDLAKTNKKKTDEYNYSLEEFRENLQLGLFYFYEPSRHAITACIKDLNNAMYDMPEELTEPEKRKELFEREGSIIHTLMDDLKMESRKDLEI